MSQPYAARIFGTSYRQPAEQLVVALAALALCISSVAAEPWESFKATNLKGESVRSQELIGQPTLLVVTPSRDAAESTREWVKALRENLQMSNFLVRDVLAVDLPFFMSEADAIEPAKKAIPERYHDHTWILDSTSLEDSLNIPTDSAIAAVVVLNSDGQIVSQVHGEFNSQRLNTVIEHAKLLGSKSSN